MCVARDSAWKQDPVWTPEKVVAVRPAQPSDIPMLLRLTRQLAAEHGETAERLTAEVLAEALWGAAPMLHALIAETHEGIAGSLLYSFGYSTFAARPRIWIEDLIVSPRHRRCGVGTTLLAALIARASELGVVDMHGLVSNDNARAQAFWAHSGARDKPSWSLKGVAVEAP